MEVEDDVLDNDGNKENLGHVHVIKEVDQLLAAWWAIVLTRLKWTINTGSLIYEDKIKALGYWPK